MPKISVIVPVYNVEKYLKKCINSILKQSFIDFELILVDDGSSDKSGKICDNYAAKDNRIKVIHKQNGGVSAARNDGIRAASGEYIMFVDSDDWLPKNALSKMIFAIEDNKADFCCGSILSFGSINTTKNLVKQYNDIDKSNLMDFISFINQIYFGPWGKLYKKEIIKKNNIVFPEQIKYLEDSIFVCEYLQLANTLCSIEDYVYMYNRINMTSATQKYYSSINYWMARYFEQFKKMFCIANKEKDLYIAEKAVLSIEFCFRHHAWLNVNDEEILRGLKNVVIVFSDEIAWIKEQEWLKENSEVKRFCENYITYIVDDDIKGLCDFLKRENPYLNRNRLKYSVRKIIIKIREFLLFRVFV